MWKSCVFGAALAAGLPIGTAAGASVITNDPTLPVLGVPFAASGGPNCFPTAGVCFQFGSLTFTSVIGSPPAPPPFNSAGQDILATAFFSGELTDISLNPLMPITLTGTVEQEVIGRTSARETGSWTTELLSVNLAGTVLGHNLTMTLHSATPSIGTTSVVQIGGGDTAGSASSGNLLSSADDAGLFQINSFFDVFVDLTLDTTPPLTAMRSAHLELAPEPASVALLTVGLLSLAATRRHRR